MHFNFVSWNELKKKFFFRKLFQDIALKNLEFFIVIDNEPANNFSKYRDIRCLISRMVGWLVVYFVSNCPLMGPGIIDGVPSMGSF